MWRSSIRLVPFSSATHGNLEIFFEPVPVTPNDEGTAGNLLIVQETNNVGITLTGLTINGEDGSAQIIEPYIPARNALGAMVNFPSGAAAGDYEYVFLGKDDNGHTGLTWSTVNQLQVYIQLLNGLSQEHKTFRTGFIPFQFRVFVPQGSIALTVRLEGPPSPDNSLGLFIRASGPMEILGATIPPGPKADFRLLDLGTGFVRIDASSMPPLQTGTSYYLTIYRASRIGALPYAISATVSK